jgi:hypothetical protein
MSTMIGGWWHGLCIATTAPGAACGGLQVSTIIGNL